MKKKRAFTIIEVLVVLGIIGILATIIILGLVQARVTARYTKTRATIKEYMTAAQMYNVDHAAFPSSVADIGTYLATNTSSSFQDGWGVAMQYNYWPYGVGGTAAVPTADMRGAVGIHSAGPDKEFTLITNTVNGPTSDDVAYGLNGYPIWHWEK